MTSVAAIEGGYDSGERAAQRQTRCTRSVVRSVDE